MNNVNASEVSDLISSYFSEIPDNASVRINQYLEILSKWNKRINLTGFSRDQWIDRIVAESLILLKAIPQQSIIQRNNSMWMDMGTGGGIPGMIIACALSDQDITLIDSRSRKTDFLRYVKSAIGLPGVKIVTGRLENPEEINPELRNNVEVFFARALAEPDKLLAYAAPYSRIKSVLISPRGGDEFKKKVNLTMGVEFSWDGKFEIMDVPQSNRKVRCLIMQRKT